MSKIIGNTTATPVPRSDWAQTDENKVDFIKNKPENMVVASDDNAVDVEVIPEGGSSVPKPLTYDYMPEGYPYIDPVGGRNLIYEWSGNLERNSTTGTHITTVTNTNKNLLTVGTTYAVVLDGKEYICVCAKYNSQHAYLGDKDIKPTTKNEPFFIYVNARNGGIHVEVNTGAYASTVAVTFSISETAPLTVPLDEKFLPDSVKCASAPVVEEISESATVLVEDGGEVKRVAKDKVGGGSGGGVSSLTLIITGSYDEENDEYVFTANKTFEECAEAVQNNSLSVIYRTTENGSYNTIIDFIYSPERLSYAKGDNGDGTFTFICFNFYFFDVAIGNSSFSELTWGMDGSFTCNA